MGGNGPEMTGLLRLGWTTGWFWFWIADRMRSKEDWRPIIWLCMTCDEASGE